MKKLKQSLAIISLLLLLLLLLSPKGLAQNKGPSGGSPSFDFRKKSESKEGTRWTLQEWLAQKDRNHLMDLWLGMYAPSPYEFYLSGQFSSYDKTISALPGTSTEQKNSLRSSSGSLGAYATLIGLIGEYENNREDNYNDLSGSLNLRLIGNAVQGTHLIIGYGQRTRNDTAQGLTLKQQFSNADLDLYLTKYFGLHGAYRYFAPQSDSRLGEVTANSAEGGVFIDFSSLRIFGTWYSDRQDSTLSGIVTKTERTGISTGIKFFF